MGWGRITQKVHMKKAHMKKETSLKHRLNILITVCLLPLTILIIYLFVLINNVSQQYDDIVQRITRANAYDINFKRDLDYIMYIIVANSERARELVDVEEPYQMIAEAREVFGNLNEETQTESGKKRLLGILKSLNTLEKCVREVETDAFAGGDYEANLERLDLDIRVLTELIQEQIQEYIYEQTRSLELLREGIREDVEHAILTTAVVLLVILAGAYMIARKIMSGITEPIRRLCKLTEQAGTGDFEIRTTAEGMDEIAVLSDSFNQMLRQIGKLVEDIRAEELNLRATELRLLQEQINPHFLYNTLDNIVWLAEADDTEQVVKMVSSLSAFFRTTLGKGRDYVTVEEEEMHIRSYLEIQQFRYRDILEYRICIPQELHGYQILKLTLQPLVENALYHGIKNKRGLGHISVEGVLEGDRLIFKVTDDGIGITPERLQEVRRLISGELEDSRKSGGFGLFNVNQRIRLNYGNDYGIRIESTYGEGTTMTVVIPAVKK